MSDSLTSSPFGSRAVFLSYAREDGEAVHRLADALRAAGLEVWVDQDELVGGDAWDAKIRRQIKECALFLPVISANTQARTEGYFRLEWRLAEQRTHLMAKGRPFLLPVVIDSTPEAEAHVPDSFLDVQWTRLAGGEADAAFCERVKDLIATAATSGTRPGFAVAAVAASGRGDPPARSAVTSVPQRPRRARAGFAAAAILLVALAGWIWWRGVGSLRPSPSPVAKVGLLSPAAVPEKSVAVLPFDNIGDEKDNEVFADGVSEELINVLGRVPGLTVKGRTSSFYFKDQKLPARDIAAQLGVAYIVRGGVRKVGNRVRMTAELSRAATDEIVWSSEPLDRELTDVFAVQSEIAGLVAKNLSLKLGASSAASTAAVNPEALALYLQGREAWKQRTSAGYDRAEELLNRALALEPGFARAMAALADVWSTRGQDDGSVGRFDGRASPQQTRIVAKIRQALAIDPDSAEARASLGAALRLGWDRAEAERELRHAISLNPNYASAHQWLGRLLLDEGRMDEALVELKRAVNIEPKSSRIVDNYGLGLFMAGRYREALETYDQAIALQAVSLQAFSMKAWALVEVGRREEGAKLARSLLEGVFISPTYKIIVLARAGFTAEAEALLPKLDERVNDRPRLLLALGRREEALGKLNLGEVSANNIAEWLFVPFIDPVRSDPRFVRFIDTLGLTAAHERVQRWRAAHPPQKAK